MTKADSQQDPSGAKPGGAPVRGARRATPTSPDSKSPLAIAREALLQLATQRTPPTPDNFRELYYRIAGVTAEDAFPSTALKAVAAALPRDTQSALRLAQAFERGIQNGQWPAFRTAMLEICALQSVEPRQWSGLIRDLLSGLERNQAGLPPERKRDALTQLLAGQMDAELLHGKLSSLVRQWSQFKPDSASAPDMLQAPAATGGAADTHFFPALLGRLLTRGVIQCADGDESLIEEARTIATHLIECETSLDPGAVTSQVDHLVTHLEFNADEQRAVRLALIKLLRLIVDNIREIVIDDTWLHGQLSLITAALDGPLDLRTLTEVESRLREVIDKQGHLKQQLSDAQQRLKSMLAGFIDQLWAFSTSTEHYQVVLGKSAERISKASDIRELSDVVEDILLETRKTQESARRSGEELTQLREQVESANAQIVRLQRELDETSEMIRHDPLTGTLNRKGLDEALNREISRMRRLGSELGIALLDVDDFKKINDHHGHLVGDDALRHLATVVRDTLRPQDAVARYGGEEFIILLPDTDAIQAEGILVRLQRELTRRYFLAENKHLLITFSAGVTSLMGEEDPAAAIRRADKAMYAAKRAGKNRVIRVS